MVFDSAVMDAEPHDSLMGRLEHRDEIQQRRGPTMKEPKKQIAKLKREQREMQFSACSCRSSNVTTRRANGTLRGAKRLGAEGRPATTESVNRGEENG